MLERNLSKKFFLEFCFKIQCVSEMWVRFVLCKYYGVARTFSLKNRNYESGKNGNLNLIFAIKYPEN